MTGQAGRSHREDRAVSANERRITDYLVVDHARLHGLLASASDRGVLDVDAFESFRAALLRHIGIEEKILFPAVRVARGGEPFQPARALRVEHAALTSLLVPTPDLALCHEIAALLRRHDEKEEGLGGVYAACERFLGADVSAQLAQRAETVAAVPLARHFDGVGTYRTAEAALEAAARVRERARPR